MLTPVCPRILVTHACNNNPSSIDKKRPLVRPKALTRRRKRKTIHPIPKHLALYANTKRIPNAKDFVLEVNVKS